MMLAFFGWNRENSRRFKRELEAERARRERELHGSVVLRPVDDQRSRSRGYFQLPLAVFGSKGADTLPATLKAFERAGAQDYVGPILLCELARDIREQCLDDMPSCFRDRVVQVEAEMLIGGTGGDSIEDVQADHKFWYRELRLYTQKWLDTIDRYRALTRVGPSMLYAELSSAGHAALAYYPIRAFRQHFPRAPVVAGAVFDARTGIRKRYPEMYALFADEGLVRGYVTTDNRLDQARNDFGMSHLLPAMTVGSWLTTEHVGALNGFGGVFPREDPGRTATISVFAESIPVFHFEPWNGKLPGIYYTTPGVVQEKIIRGIESLIADDSLMGLPFERSPKGSARVLNVIAPIAPQDFQQDIVAIQDRVGGWLKEIDVDMTVQFISMGQPLTPQSETAIVTLVLLQGVDAGPDKLEQLAEGTYPIDAKFLAGNHYKPRDQEQPALTDNSRKASRRRLVQGKE